MGAVMAKQPLLRFTTDRRPVVHHDDLGAPALLDRIPPNLVHLHHSSVARRLENLGRTMGFDLTDPAGRAGIALTLWRLVGDGRDGR